MDFVMPSDLLTADLSLLPARTLPEPLPRIIRTDDLESLARLYLISYPPGIGAGSHAEAISEIAATFEGDYGVLRPGASLVAEVGGRPAGAVLTVERDGSTVDLSVSPVTGAQGARLVGVTAGYEYVSASPADVAAANWHMFTGTTAVVTRLPQAVWQVGRSVFTDEKRDSSGVVSVVGVGRLAGEVTGDSQALGLHDTRQVVAVLLSLLASLNMALFVFNLIPLPPLDGGHILGAIYEGVRRTVARVRGAEDPGPADTARLVPVTWVVGGLLVAMSVILIVADIVKPVSLG